MTTFIVIIALALMVLFTWNIITLNKIKNNGARSSELLKDSKYWELKYKIEFLIATVVLATGILGYLGFNSKQNIESNIKEDIIKVTQSVQGSMDSVRDSIRYYQSEFDNLNRRQTVIENLINNSSKKGNDISLTIDKLSKNPLLNLNYYIVQNIRYDVHGGGNRDSINHQEYFFKNLKNSLGQALPKFGKRPLIIAASDQRVTPKVSFTTEESFVVTITDRVGSYNDYLKILYFYIIVIVI